ncbi:MAG: hypothetical protein ACD_3C00172G0001 [uncultured bacterium (gcode 4)]|uniref:Peptidase C39-like domain-containing protein n=1 Tax=uncultured bacterium (gcode 4) TaxID=1234023 RepID=K2GBX1_9BACT|nr:MAG: hypothetical protein ACD_3C00172G0001 [uncultured bacterium (gcode 4)]
MSTKLSRYITFFMYILIFVLIVLTFLVLVDGFYWSSKTDTTPVVQRTEITKAPQAVKDPQQTKDKAPSPSAASIVVPFVSQAPFGNWWNSIYKEWCEEASIIMAVYWAKWKELTATIADAEIKKISDFETKLLWNYLDTSVYDTAKVMKEYFSFDQYKIVENVTKNGIKDILNNWKIVIVPAYWRDLKNPNYTPPGPVEHMLVVTWYDPKTKKFITNDPWTKSWKSFKYDEDVLFNAIWSYSSSSSDSKASAYGKRVKTVIEVSKTQ